MEHQVRISAPDMDLEQIHPSLRETFVSLPGGEELLTPEQLDAIFGGDHRALRDMASLLFQNLEKRAE